MSRKSIFAVALAAILGVFVFFIGGREVKADLIPSDQVPDSAFRYTGSGSTIEFGDPAPVGDLYFYGHLISPADYDIVYNTPDGGSSSSDYMYLGKTGTINIRITMGITIDGNTYFFFNRAIGTFTVNKGNINKINFTVPSGLTIFDNDYDHPVVTMELSKNKKIQYPYGSNEDLSIAYGSTANPDNKNVGTGTITLTAAGSELVYGTKTLTYNIAKGNLKKSGIYLKVNDAEYTGKPVRPEVYIRNYGHDIKVLDSEMTFKDNIETGTATVTVSGGRFLNSLSTTFTIYPYRLDSYDFQYEELHFTYTGSEIRPGLSMVKAGLTKNGARDLNLLRDIDYEIVEYGGKNVNVSLNDNDYGWIKIRGIGNFTNEKYIHFKIDPLPFSKAEVSIPPMTVTDTYSDLEEVIKVTYEGKELIKGKDYAIKSPGADRYFREGDQVTITGLTPYVGAITRNVGFEMIDLSKCSFFISGSTPVYTGEELIPESLVVCGKDLRGTTSYISSQYYTVSFSDNINAGTAKVTITGDGKTTFNSNTATFKISQAGIGNAALHKPSVTRETLNSSLEPTFTLDSKELVKGRDYDLELDNHGLGKVKATIKGKGNYTGERSFNYRISASIAYADVKTITLTAPEDPKSSKVKVDLEFAMGKIDLEEGKDYEITSISDFNIDSETLTVTINGINDCYGTNTIDPDLSGYFEEFGNLNELRIPDRIYLTNAEDPFFERNGRVITKSDLFEMCYMPAFKTLDPVSSSKGRLMVDLSLDQFAIRMIKTYNILPASLKNASVAAIPDAPYTGHPETPEPVVTLNGNKLVKDRDYKVEYKDNINPGTARIIITGIGNCVDSIETTFVISRDITPTPTASPKPTAAPTSAAKPTGTVKPTGSVKPSVTKPATVTSKPVVTTTPSAADATSQIMDFVKRIYTYVLDREPEEEGAKFWTDELYSFRRTGAEVGLQFIFSDEFVNRNLSDADFVTVLYNTFFGREPEEGGFKFWTGALADGTLDRAAVANGFVYSQEWADTCARYGIRSGGLTPSVDIAPSDATYAFVERMYTTAMDRASDEEGKNFWANELSNFRFTGEQVGAMFFLSDEMNGFGLSNEEFVTRLYKTFMDREPEEGGYNFWVGYLADGGSREGAVLGFTRSEEFVNKCIVARILPY